jgi:hypothetical protein
MIPRITPQNIYDPNSWDDFENFGFAFFEIGSQLSHDRQSVKDNFQTFFHHSSAFVDNFPEDKIPHIKIIDNANAEKPFSAIELEMSPERLLGFIDTPETQNHLAGIRSTLMNAGDIMAGRWQRFVSSSFFNMCEVDEKFKAMFFPNNRDHMEGVAPYTPTGLMDVVDVFNHKTLQYWDPLLLTWWDLVQPPNHVTVIIGAEFREAIGNNKIATPLFRVDSCPLNSLMLGYSVSRNKTTPVIIEDDDGDFEFHLVPQASSDPIMIH